MKKCLFIAFLGLCALAGQVFGAEITVPNLELASMGLVEDGNFGIRSSLEAEFSITGGYKYSINLGLGAEIPNLEKALSYGRFDILSMTAPGDFNDRMNNQAVLSFRSINGTIREIFGSPLELSLFIGNYDKLGSGVDFPGYFGTVPVGTGYKGFFYFPQGLNGDPFFRFNGAIHSIKGTGLALKGIFGNIAPALYIYHDLSFSEGFTQDNLNPGGNYDPGRYSADLRLLANWEYAKFEVFFGYTYANHDNSAFRGGTLAWVGYGPVALLIQAGITYYEAETCIKLDNCYFLLEPQLRIGVIGVNATFFYRPVFYMNRIINDGTEKTRHTADANARVFYKDETRSPFEAGIEGTTNFDIKYGTDVNVRISPYISAVTSGLRWEFALRFNPKYKWEDENLLEGFIGIQTSF